MDEYVENLISETTFRILVWEISLESYQTTYQFEELGGVIVNMPSTWYRYTPVEGRLPDVVTVETKFSGRGHPTRLDVNHTYNPDTPLLVVL